MAVQLTEAEFSKHVNTKFRVGVEPPLDLELIEVKGYMSRPEEETGLERFSAFFRGPNDRFLEQQTYSFQHDEMGDFALFLVPVKQDQNGFRYEAVFNYYKNP